MGPFSIIQMMCGQVVRSVMETYHGENRTIFLDEETLMRVTPNTIASILTLTIGVLCIVCGMLHVEFLADYFSEPLVGGFLFGAAFHILVQQFDAAIGVKKPKTGGLGHLFIDLYNIYTLVPHANITSCIISACSLVFLILFKIILHPQLEKLLKQKINISYELILVIASITTCYFMHLDTRQGVAVVGPIPRGLPTPAIPEFFLIRDVIWDAVAIIIVQGAIHMSMIKMMAQRLNYKVCENQEIYTVGFVLTLSGFLPVYPTSNALSRPQVLVECGATSQIHNFVAGGLMLCVLLALGPLFYWLPMPVLAAIIIISLRNLFIRGYDEMRRYWKVSGWDFSIWIVAFVATIADDVIAGLAIGIAFEFFSIVLRTQEPRWNAQFSKKDDQTDICVFTFEAMLLFTNADRFKRGVRQILAMWDNEKISKDSPKTFILDCAAMVELDFVGAKALKEILADIQKAECDLYMVRASHALIATMEKEGAKFNPRYLFCSIDDAMACARSPRKSMSISIADKRKRPKGMAFINFEQFKNASVPEFFGTAQKLSH
ncbi:hypothetical protein M3Y97_01034600 [Aphelenchoides bicaudatus]|nr:hypothetical protein M3Y97_01034600 [Aphelenchoides bicaudatus]